ncbi:MAG: YggS family pyridoxal phosphate-dependent enzyme [Chloroflexi bacterium]|nr:YggS family pyridoxal phosphate-dependent enzyme [Chloroflexota bacterium]
MESGRADRPAEPRPYRFDPADAARLGVARARVLERIEHACRRVGRDAGEVDLVAVSKTVPVERLRAALAAGLTTFGENRVQEGVEKAALLPAASWHLIGPLQSNKARRAVEAFATIQSVGDAGLAARLDRLAGELRPGRRLPILLQVNVDGDPAKSGFPPDDLASALPGVLAHPNLDVRGLMTVGRLVDHPADARPTFVALRHLAEALRPGNAGLGPELSMGMSDDFEVAVEEGATIVRIGRLIFGARAAGGG